MICSLIGMAYVALYLLRFKSDRKCGTSKIEFFNSSGSERVKHCLLQMNLLVSTIGNQWGEAATRGVSKKKFLKISQHSQENPCAGVNTGVFL